MFPKDCGNKRNFSIHASVNLKYILVYKISNDKATHLGIINNLEEGDVYFLSLLYYTVLYIFMVCSYVIFSYIKEYLPFLLVYVIIIIILMYVCEFTYSSIYLFLL